MGQCTSPVCVGAMVTRHTKLLWKSQKRFHKNILSKTNKGMETPTMNLTSCAPSWRQPSIVLWWWQRKVQGCPPARVCYWIRAPRGRSFHTSSTHRYVTWCTDNHRARPGTHFTYHVGRFSCLACYLKAQHYCISNVNRQNIKSILQIKYTERLLIRRPEWRNWRIYKKDSQVPHHDHLRHAIPTGPLSHCLTYPGQELLGRILEGEY